MAGAPINGATSRFDGVDIADRVGEIDMVKDIEELRPQLEAAGLTDTEVPGDRQVDVRLARPSQAVAPDIADVGAELARGGSSSGTRDRLTRQNGRPGECERVKKEPRRNIADGCDTA